MSNRDELARDIDGVLYSDSFYGDMFRNGQSRETLITAIIAAGYRKPWVITTAAERAILQPGTICMDKDGNAWKRGTGSWVSTGGDTGPLYDEDDLELTVLHEGTQP